MNLNGASPQAPQSATAEWTNLVPLAFAPAAAQPGPDVLTQASPVSTSGRNGGLRPSQVLDLLVPTDGDSAAVDPNGNPEDAAFRIFDLDADGVTTGPFAFDANTGADWLDIGTGTDPASVSAKQNRAPTVEVLLQRRANPLRLRNDPAAGTDFAAQERDNPWVTIDRMAVRATQLNLREEDDQPSDPDDPAATPNSFLASLLEPAMSGPNGDARNTKGRKVASRVRRRPLLRASELGALDRTETGMLPMADREPELGALITNSIGGHSAQAPRRGGKPAPFDLWQPHFDRPFAGPADLIGVPLYGPGELTGLLATTDVAAGREGFEEFDDGATPELRQIGLGYMEDPQSTDAEAPAAVLNRNGVAGSRLLYPDVRRVPNQAVTMAGLTATPPVTTFSGGAGVDGYFNMWFRLLQYADTLRPNAGAPGALPGTVRLGPTARLDRDGTFSLGEVREPGRINLNTLRDPEVLAGLLDDFRVHQTAESGGYFDPMTMAFVRPQLRARETGETEKHEPSAIGGATNDWYRSLLVSRDGLDPLAAPTSWTAPNTFLSLPGLGRRLDPAIMTGADGSPFLPYLPPADRLDASDAAKVSRDLRAAIDRTALRARPNGAAPAVVAAATPNADLNELTNPLPRAFFGTGGADVKNPADFTKPEDPALDLDFTTRYRLLNKVLNNSTERSNAFLVWVQVDFFHARELRRGVVEPATDGTAAGRQRFTRIGAMRDDSPAYRGMFVVDRSRVPELLRAAHLPTTVDPDGSLAETGTVSGDETRTYSFARDPLSGGVLFPWQDLVIHRERVQ